MMRGSILPLSAVLLALLAAARGQEVCSNAESVIATFDETVSARLTCNDQPTYRWWRSNDGCRSFVKHTNCTAQDCIPTVDASLERYYHFCCTDENVVAGSEVATASPTCFHIQICTAISNEVTPPIVLLGATEKLYVLLFGEPTPTDSPELKLVNATNAVLIRRLSAPQIDFTYLNDTTSEQAFIYTFNVPDDIDDDLSVSDVKLEFSTQYSTPSDSCSGLRDTTIDIPVRRTRATATPAPTGTACSPTAVPCRNVTNLAAGFIASSVILLLLLLLLAVILVVICWRLKRHQRINSDSNRPPDLPITGRQYQILRQSSVTPGTPGTTFANYGQQPPLPPLPITTADTAFTDTAETTTALPTTSQYETPQTLLSRDSTATSNTDEVVNARMSDSQSTDTERMGPNAVDYTDSSHLATDYALETESTVIRHHGAVYDGLNRELPNPGLSIDV